jgi:hypothetical protein
VRKTWSLIQFIVFAQALFRADPASLLSPAPLSASLQQQDLRMDEAALLPADVQAACERPCDIPVLRIPYYAPVAMNTCEAM